MLTPRIQRMRDRYFNTIPSITAERLVLETEAYQKFAGDAVPIFRAKVVNYILERMTTLVLDDELIVGTATNAYRGANLHPEFQSSSWYISDIDEFQTRTKDPYYISAEDRETILATLPYWEGKAMEDVAEEAMPAYIKELESDDILCVGLENGVSGETTCDHEKIMAVGIRGYIDECQRNIDAIVPQTMEDQAKVDFWKACIIQSEGLITYAHRMADEADRLADACDDPVRAAELRQMAENCRVVPENPPQTFWQACQMVWFIHVAFYIEVCTTAIGFGRFDQYMWPFYKKDVIDEKNITRDQALEILESLYLKSCEVYEVRDSWYATSFAGYPMWQILVVGGQTRDGKDASNDLSMLCLEAADALQTTQPVMALRVCDTTPEELIRFGCKMTQEGQANPGFFNDATAMKMALAKGGTLEDARDWTIVGCIQAGPGGGGTDGSPDAGYVNMGKMIEFVLHDGVDPATGKLMGLRTGDPREFKNIEQFKDALKKQIVHAYDQIRIGYNLMQSIHMNRYPVIFASMVTRGCVENGKSVQHGGANVSTAGMYVTGAANLADSIAAVEKCVFEDHDLTMEELIRACDTNFEGQERLRQMLLNKPPKYGNDDPHVDAIYREMMHHIAETVQQWPDARGGHYAFGIDSQTMNLPHGQVTGALPDGRLAGESLCDASSPMMGRDICGPTSTVKSVAAIDQDILQEGALFNLRFDPKGVQGEKGIDIIEGVVKTFFQNGGEHIQINVVDNDTLIDAQKHPELHRGLMVRVAGYMAYFTELDKQAQDTIIRRTPHLSR
ncbi:4-hydroxyphenylacetate decarboxylase large subunit [Slackia heliotrinireducens]|uniref:Pyruvate-formate lyase n=1 Tax=Slackia heliotrinireducens (strain ATCC 29202 / DSM 20476 / NCTC 11029 / RHS 1) TaxID=471855 RepID=C7N778_SLAHD|nr:pyruvate formate lyase family protein [Slackia heliotrinireducens]ACV22763.1 pyruvate-formate lyase [Slackia heliotrinireducens DSM 20476]VEH01430.1 4-hydroxyphenylacetate decarboxylase large subunit [Slackia heliotrinireducens]